MLKNLILLIVFFCNHYGEVFEMEVDSFLFSAFVIVCDPFALDNN